MKLCERKGLKKTITKHVIRESEKKTHPTTPDAPSIRSPKGKGDLSEVRTVFDSTPTGAVPSVGERGERADSKLAAGGPARRSPPGPAAARGGGDDRPLDASTERRDATARGRGRSPAEKDLAASVAAVGRSRAITRERQRPGSCCRLKAISLSGLQRGRVSTGGETGSAADGLAEPAADGAEASTKKVDIMPWGFGVRWCKGEVV